MLISFRKESRSKIKKCLKIAIAFLIVFTVAVSLLPRFEIHAAHTFSSGAVVIDSQAVADYGTEYIFLEDMKRFFGSRLPGIAAVAEPVVHPFQVI